MMTKKRIFSFLLALALILSMVPAPHLSAAAAETESQEETVMSLPSEVHDHEEDHAFGIEEPAIVPCEIHGAEQKIITEEPELTDVGDEISPIHYANGDTEASADGWTYQMDAAADGRLYRETYDFTDKTYLSDGPVYQICELNGKLYALMKMDTADVIASLDLETMQWNELVSVSMDILHFAVAEETIYYLAEETVYSFDNSKTEVLFRCKKIDRFWLAETSVLEYIADNERVVRQYDIQTGQVTAYTNPISVLQESVARGLGTSSLRQKFPAGKYWNHANNPGKDNSLNNQDGYTSTPCPKHKTIGTSSQTCNAFMPGSTQLSWQCMGYAEKLGYDATGSNPRVNTSNGWYTNTSTSALDSLKAGDIVRYKSNNHSIYVIGVNGDTVTYTDCNSDGHCIIRWDATISKSTLRQTYSYVRVAPTAQNPEAPSCSCSTAYAGNYICTTSGSNLNMRSGHGTSYSIVTTIPPGQVVYVSKASGADGWAHAQYNGYNGYVSMEYLTKQGTTTNRNSRIVTWFSNTTMGNNVDSVRTGEWLYLCYKVYDSNSGDLFDTYNTAGYSVSMKIYDPTGAVTYEYAYGNDNNYIGVRRNAEGTYRGEVTFKYNSGATTVVTTSINVKYEPRIEASATDISLSMTGTSQNTVTVSHSGATKSETIYVNASYSGSCYTTSWGSWSNHSIPLTVTGTKAGTGTITLRLYDADTDDLLATTSINVFVEAPEYTVSYSANGGSGAPSSQTKEYNVPLTLNSTIPTRFGYNFKGWATSSGATSASYQPGGSYTSNSGCTLYAVWSAANEMSGSYGAFTREAEIKYGGTGVYYKFIPNTTTYYRIVGTGTTDTRVYLYNSSGTQLASDDDSGGNYQFKLEYSFTANETYYIYVRFYNSSTTGALPFSVLKRYSISYNANGGSGAPNTQYKYFDETLTLSTTRPGRTGYTFVGWSTSSTASSAEYQPGDSYTGNANRTLYAVWKNGCAEGHSYSYTLTLAPTDSTTGKITGICQYCQNTTTITLPKLSTDDYNRSVLKESKCTTDGVARYVWKTKTYGTYYFDTVIPAKGHKYSARVISPGCTTQGYTIYTCVHCQDQYTGQYVDALGHSYAEGVCKNCGDVRNVLEAPEVKISNVSSSGKIKLSWASVAGAQKYQVYRATSKNGTYSLKKTTTSTSFTNTSTVAGKTYYYKVAAVAADGTVSEYSDVVSRTCDLPRPELTVSNVASSGKIKISWDEIEGAVEYEVYRATSSDGNYSRVKTTSNTSFTNTSATAGKTYYYKVKAIASNSSANSAYSERASRTCDLPRPEVSIALSSGKPKVSWDKVEGAVSYKVYRATSNSGTYSLMKTTTSLSYKNTSATAGNTYYYKVVAVCSNTAGNSAYSKVVSIKATK